MNERTNERINELTSARKLFGMCFRPCAEDDMPFVPRNRYFYRLAQAATSILEKQEQLPMSDPKAVIGNDQWCLVGL